MARTTLLLLTGLLAFALAPAPTRAATAAEDPFHGAAWIAPPTADSDPATAAALPLLRREFLLPFRPAKATLRITGLGDYDPSVNGTRLADTGINQPWSVYESTLYYRDFDVTALLTPGTNCLGVMLTHSFWHNPNPPAGRYNKGGPQRRGDEPLRLRAELVVEDSPGTSTTRLATDASWKTFPGPIVFSHIFAGEDFDARRVLPGWDQPGFKDTAWNPVRVLPPAQGVPVPQSWPGIQSFDRFKPSSVREAAPGVHLFSFAQNAAAQLDLELAGGRPGARVDFRCGEHRNDKDRLFGGYVVGCSLVTDGQPLRHRWNSFYLGMQYVEVTGAVPEGHPNPDGLPVIRRLELVHVRSGLPETGTFRCSSTLLNRTHTLIDWAMKANMSHVLTDCPHREKLGWLECSYLLAPSFSYRYDTRGWFAKITRDIRESQGPDGKVPTVAPSYPKFSGGFDDTLEWGAASVLLPWHHYEWYGDSAILRDAYDSMKRYLAYIESKSDHGIAAAGGLGDWYDYGHGKPPGESRFTPPQLSATATWALCARTVANAAEVLGHTDDARHFRELHGRIADAFRRRFLDPTTQRLRHTGSPQCANAMALVADLVPADLRPALVEGIIDDLRQRNFQQTPGDVGHVHFIRALAQAGRSDILHQVYRREGNGSYGGILAKGLTSLPETWDAMMDGSQSLNHCMLGHVMEWFYGHVAGIRQPPEGIGWTRVLIAPEPGDLTSAEASITTPRGRITSRWTRTALDPLRLEVTLPPAIDAEAILPSGRHHRLEAGTTTVLVDR